jgi:MazG family protein
MRDLSRLETLVAIMDRLREPGGCPWDREQTYQTLRRYLVEEAYEAADALDQGDPHALREELGDLLFQIVFLCRLAKEDGEFTVESVIRGIAEKMIRRHPHVFGTAIAATAEDVVASWEAIKRSEKAPPRGTASSPLDGIPSSLPPLMKAQQLGERAARVGFDWQRPEDVLDKIEEELGEVRSALARDDRPAAQGELGDLMFTAVMLARRLAVDADAALERANRKFRRRFGWVERELARGGGSLADADPRTLERLWQASKLAEPQET